MGNVPSRAGARGPATPTGDVTSVLVERRTSRRSTLCRQHPGSGGWRTVGEPAAGQRASSSPQGPARVPPAPAPGVSRETALTDWPRHVPARRSSSPRLLDVPCADLGAQYLAHRSKHRVDTQITHTYHTPIRELALGRSAQIVAWPAGHRSACHRSPHRPRSGLGWIGGAVHAHHRSPQCRRQV
jgi:hypothetical protein